MGDSAEHDDDASAPVVDPLPNNSPGAPVDASVAASTAPAAEATAGAADGASGEQSDVGSYVDIVRERGFITTGELFAAFPNLEPDTDELRRLYEAIESRGVKILDEIAEELQLEDQRRAGGQPEADDTSTR